MLLLVFQGFSEIELPYLLIQRILTGLAYDGRTFNVAGYSTASLAPSAVQEALFVEKRPWFCS